MIKHIIKTEQAPEPVGPYSQAVKADHLLFLSGQIPVDPATGNLVIDDFSSQCHRVLQNIKAVLEAGNSNLGNVLKVTIFLTDLSNFNQFNEIYAAYFDEAKPARSCVEVSRLPKGVNIEIEAIAWAPALS